MTCQSNKRASLSVSKYRRITSNLIFGYATGDVSPGGLEPTCPWRIQSSVRPTDGTAEQKYSPSRQWRETLIITYIR